MCPRGLAEVVVLPEQHGGAVSSPSIIYLQYFKRSIVRTRYLLITESRVSFTRLSIRVSEISPSCRGRSFLQQTAPPLYILHYTGLDPYNITAFVKYLSRIAFFEKRIFLTIESYLIFFCAVSILDCD